MIIPWKKFHMFIDQMKNPPSENPRNGVSYSHEKLEINRLSSFRVIVGNVFEKLGSRKMHLKFSSTYGTTLLLRYFWDFRSQILAKYS